MRFFRPRGRRRRYDRGVRARLTALALATAAAVGAGGCDRQWHVRAVQPRLLLGVDPVARSSTEQAILLSDMYLPPGLRLPNSAQIVLVTRDRLRARVRLIHRWKDMTDLNRWKAWLEDDRGRRLYPTAVEPREAGHIHTLVIPERDGFNHDTGFVYRVPVNLYDGGGDYVFYAPGFYRPDLRRLTLVLERSGYRFRYTWQFYADADAEPPEVADLVAP
ncbi:MAG: hypothetical protein D6689_03125 [Deltaproteobacteria bacterium]|nr:MAG: hypothetical protein D6689_03125 [Deltaproteobacteria bacterium]